MKSFDLTGRVTRYQSGFFVVSTPQGVFTCVIRGRLKRRTFQGDILGIGDDVNITRLSPDTGVIEDILPRKNALVRMDPTPRGDYQQILLANPDQLVAIFACANPEPHLRMLDRFLVVGEKQRVPSIIVVNKVDLENLEKVKEKFKIYPDLGYPVVYTSAKAGIGIEELSARLVNKISAFAGPSGVGKSSLLNAIQPGLGVAVNEISEATNKGKHTTVVRELFPLNEGGFVADLPGIRRLALWDTEPEELDGYFPELRDLVSECQFNDCTHRNEPGCAVVEAVESGKVSQERYVSYLKLRYGDEAELEG
ncbi:Small ribosomal subunit biogenesis GTPase RsgA [bioreactor metagenome]|uniref:Small ribosomal subunit biogenesis GTPase RsgA n=1 Tax=bioreactor metagenome TaxID=1076179 RepID=A0A645CJJ3_9ZZZZ